jgi:hypothetical protein
MNCSSFYNVRDLHAEGRLTPRLAKSVARHLASCAACRALAVPAPAAAPGTRAPESFKEKLRAAAKASSGTALPDHAPAAGLPLWPREARGIALAAVLLLVVGLIVSATGVPSQSAGAGVAAVEEP